METPGNWFATANCVKKTEKVEFKVKIQVMQVLHLCLKYHSSTGVFSHSLVVQIDCLVSSGILGGNG